MKTKVLIVVTKSNMGGAQRYVYDLATHLPKERFDVVVATGKAQGSSGPGMLLEMLQGAGIRTSYLPDLERNVGIADLNAYREIARAIRNEKPDVLHLNSSKAGGLGALAGRFHGVRRIIFTSHGLPYDESRGPVQKFLILLATWATFLLSHFVICISDDVATRARKMPGVASKVRRIFNGLSPVDFLPRDVAREQLRMREPRIPQDVPIIGTIAELVPNKGLSYGIEACTYLLENNSKFAYALIGTGDLEKQLRAEIKEGGLEANVFMLGNVPNARTYMQAFDIFLLPSVKEGIPYVLLEAAQARLPIVGTYLPGIFEVVGEDGRLAPPREGRELEVYLKTLLEEPETRIELGEKISRRVEEKFSLEKMVADTVALY